MLADPLLSALVTFGKRETWRASRMDSYEGYTHVVPFSFHISSKILLTNKYFYECSPFSSVFCAVLSMS